MNLQKITEILTSVVDPETKTNVIEMGFAHDIKYDNEIVTLTFRPPSFTCPVAIPIAVEMKQKLLAEPEIKDVNIKVINYIKPQMIDSILSGVTKVPNK